MVGVNRPEAMRARAEQLLEQGFRRFQVKVGSGHWHEDVQRARACLDVLRDQEVVILDANAYWRQHEAAQFIAALEDEPIYLEQPCRTLAECLAIRRRTALTDDPRRDAHGPGRTCSPPRPPAPWIARC